MGDQEVISHLWSSAMSVQINTTGEFHLGAGQDVNHLDWSGVDDPLEANLLLIRRQKDDVPILLVTIDLLYVGRLIREVILNASQLPSENVIIAASHTHRAPMTDDTKPKLGVPDSDFLDSLSATLTGAVQDLISRPMEKSTLNVSSVNARFSINRRRRKPLVIARQPRINAVVNAPNPDGATDDTLTSISIRRLDGSAIAVIWNYACHPVAGPIRKAISAHYPGFARVAVRGREADQDLPVLFLQGFSGNTRPSASVSVHSFRRRLRQLISGPLFENMTSSSYEEWSTNLAKSVENCIDRERPVSADYLSAARVELNGELFYKPGSRPVTFSRIDLGKSITIIGMSGEVVAEYAPRLRSYFNDRNVCCVGCLDDTFGYVPTGKIVREGGYEAGGFCDAFGLEQVNPSIERSVMSGFAKLLTGAEMEDSLGWDEP